MDLQEIQGVLNQSRDLVALFDKDLRYSVANKEYSLFWGVEKGDILGEVVGTPVVLAEVGISLTELKAKCFAGEDVHFERWITYPGVGRRFMEGMYTSRRNEAGEVTGVLHISRDLTKSKDLQAEILAERDKYDTILSSINAGVILYDDKLEIVWSNLELKDLSSHSELLGMKCHGYCQKQNGVCEDCPTIRAMESGETHYKELYLEYLDQWHALHAIPVFDSEGKVDKVLGIDMDITERKRSLEALEAREAELESIVRVSQAGIGVVKDRYFTRGNDYLFKMLGYTPDELVGQSTRIAYISDEEYERVGKLVYDQMESVETATSEAQWVCKDGSILDVLLSITPMNVDAPKDGLTFVAMDISEIKRANETVRESEKRFRNIFENVEMIAVQGYDRNRKVVYWNPASERLYGYSQEEAMGQLLEDLIIPESLHEEVRTGHAAWVKDGIEIPAGELELVHKDGSAVPVYSSHVMQETSLGDKVMYCVDVDLAEIKRIHNQLVQAKEDAEAANQAKSEFLANMSHEIRTPLNGIQGMLALLQTTELDEAQREYAQAGLESAVRLNRLLSDILDISRVEAGKMALESQPFHLPNLVKQVREFFRISFDGSGVNLHCRIGDDVPCHVLGDSARLQQVLTNLVGNGLKYTNEGDVHLDVCCLSPLRKGEHRILFSVQDTGIGISNEVLESLFKPFVQGSRGYARQYQGAGLGLSICKRLVDLMDGNMSVESNEGEGTIFYVVLPFLERRGGEVETQPIVSGDRKVSALSILLAEDDRVNSMVGQRILEKLGCEVTVAANGAVAVDLLKDQAFDAVFMDVQMPEMDGVEATRIIREGGAGEACKGIPIFAMTAYTMVGDKENFLSAGMDGYISKPVEVKEILAMLSLALQKAREKGA
jgi:PAS domain S-box-containing protein